jgi:meso-butanediol dehydrogenase / (S,S)-butanediol dehydrogenase / diacetyl reductase
LRILLGGRFEPARTIEQYIGEHPIMTAAASNQKPVVLVTGASSGIGDGIARRFAKAGWRVVAVARRKERLDALARELSRVSDTVAFAADVNQPKAGNEAVAFAMKSFGRLDCLVNNAGSGKWAAVHETDDATVDEVVETSLKAPFRFSRAALPVMKPGSSIIMVGSVFGVIGGMNGGIYCAVKAGLIGLTQALAVQYGAQGIRANLVAPGVIKTDMTKDYWEDPLFRRINQEMTPMNREGTIEDVANAVYFLASEEGSFINGHTLALDGGWSSTKFISYGAMIAKTVQT